MDKEFNAVFEQDVGWLGSVRGAVAGNRGGRSG